MVMKHLDVGRRSQIKPSQEPITISETTRKFVNAIFFELQAAFPAWRYTFPTNESLAVAKGTWVKALMEARITSKAQIAQGLRVARQSESTFFPSAGQFIAWCRSFEGIPDVDSAFSLVGDYIMNIHQDIPMEIKAMFDLIDRSVLRTRSETDLYRVFKRNYRFICEQLIAGESIHEYLRAPIITGRSESFEQSELRRLRVLSEIEKTRARLGLKR